MFIVNKKRQHNVVNDVVLDVFTVNLEEISHLALFFLLLT